METRLSQGVFPASTKVRCNPPFNKEDVDYRTRWIQVLSHTRGELTHIVLDKLISDLSQTKDSITSKKAILKTVVDNVEYNQLKTALRATYHKVGGDVSAKAHAAYNASLKPEKKKPRQSFNQKGRGNNRQQQNQPRRTYNDNQQRQNQRPQQRSGNMVQNNPQAQRGQPQQFRGNNRRNVNGRDLKQALLALLDM